MLDAVFGVVKQDELPGAALQSEPHGCASLPRCVADAILMRVGLVPAQFAEADEFLGTCIPPGALLCNVAVPAENLEWSEDSTMADEPRNDRVIQWHSRPEMTFETK